MKRAPIEPGEKMAKAIARAKKSGKLFKADGIIDTQTRQKAWDLVLKLRQTHDVDKVQQLLKVEVPKLETDNIEVSAQKTKSTQRSAAVVDKKDLEKEL